MTLPLSTYDLATILMLSVIALILFTSVLRKK